jgi:hypothetical protein
VKEGRDLEFQKEPSSWQNFKELSIRSTEIKNLSDKKITTLTFYKEVKISQDEINQLKESVSILIPYISNAYEIYFNGEKIASGGLVINDEFVRYEFRRNLIAKIPTPLLKTGVNEIYIIRKGK